MPRRWPSQMSALNALFNTVLATDEIFKWDNIMFMCFDIFSLSLKKSSLFPRPVRARRIQDEKIKKLTWYLNIKKERIHFVWMSSDELLMWSMTNWKSRSDSIHPYWIWPRRRTKFLASYVYGLQVHHYVFFLNFFPHQKKISRVRAKKRRNIFCNQANIPKPSQGTH